MDPASLACVLKHSHSQWFEERLLLASLLRAANGRPGTFVELGALDGVKYSNTLALERCYNWTGLLIEANPTNFARARQHSGRRAALVHAAVCAEGVGSLNVTTRGGPAAGIVSAILGRADSNRAEKRLSLQREKTVTVPCKPLSRLMSDHGLADGAHLLSLDVEGEEPTVLRTAGSARFSYALVETASSGVERQQAARKAMKSMPTKETLAVEGEAPARATAHDGTASSLQLPPPPPLSSSATYTASSSLQLTPPQPSSTTAPSDAYTACVDEHASSHERQLLPSLLGATNGAPGIFVEVGVASEEHPGAGSGGGGEPSLARALEKCYGWRGVRIGGLRTNDTLCAEFDGGSVITKASKLPPCRGRTLAAVARAAGFEKVDYVHLTSGAGDWPSYGLERAFEPPRYAKLKSRGNAKPRGGGGGSASAGAGGSSSNSAGGLARPSSSLVTTELRPRDKNQSWHWAPPTWPWNTVSALLVRWHYTAPAWTRCTGCRISSQLPGIHHDRRFLAGKGYRAYWRNCGARNGGGAVECFGTPHGCGDLSELSCEWAESQWRS